MTGFEGNLPLLVGLIIIEVVLADVVGAISVVCVQSERFLTCVEDKSLSRDLLFTSTSVRLERSTQLKLSFQLKPLSELNFQVSTFTSQLNVL